MDDLVNAALFCQLRQSAVVARGFSRARDPWPGALPQRQACAYRHHLLRCVDVTYMCFHRRHCALLDLRRIFDDSTVLRVGAIHHL